MGQQIVKMLLEPAHEQIKVYVIKEGMKEAFLKFCKDGTVDSEGKRLEGVCKWLRQGKTKKADFWVCEQESGKGKYGKSESEEGHYGKSVTLIVAAVGKSDDDYHDWYKIAGIKEFLVGGDLANPYLKVESCPDLRIQEGWFHRLLSYIGWQIRRIVPAA